MLLRYRILNFNLLTNKTITFMLHEDRDFSCHEISSGFQHLDQSIVQKMNSGDASEINTLKLVVPACGPFCKYVYI